ncbi:MULTISPECIES: LysR substrate-binding domain-containing protein [Pseudomonas]|uniref:LysR substrate-binding domain-containing protein n=1 Tax=Pseudomonas TaxID=286 RepID=UPI000DA79084|nr:MULTISPECIES: LysR substrate-binding domain-containing protein [Pseudomonas]MDW3711861.1 LysR substrate-binding domain-containing protein [Pseudomonas sp. 2023EL-01195]PZE10221.1 transcriptional regulator [Pseudomonas sp. 57B-090624]
MNHMPPLASLRSFEAVARLGSITRAAAELHVTHSAISQQIKQLELLLGLPLFVREGRGLRLNEDGRLYALQIRRALEDIGEATRLVRDRPEREALTIAVMPSFGAQWLLPRLPRFQARHPLYRIHLQASLGLQDLRQSGVDLAIRMGQGNWEGLERRRLFDDELLLVASPRLNGGDLPQTPQQALRLPLIRTAEPWLRWCQAAGVDEPPADLGLWINDSNLVLEALRLCQGIALERRSLVQGALARGELVQLTGISVPYAFPYWLVWQPGEGVGQKHEDFGTWLDEEAALYRASIGQAR